ncbi:MAG: Ig-like domain-containing protein [Anaerolineae bacterium]|nr:Ig-like domain-containing protein [Anaerolineae bacterium]
MTLTASNPANGSTAARRVYNVELTFASPMDRDSLRVEVTPSVGTQTVFWPDENNMKAQVSGDFLPSAGYTVVVKGDSKTRDGRRWVRM